MNRKLTNLVNIYKEMDAIRLQEEIDGIFDHIYAMLEACECDSIEAYPNPNVKLEMICRVIADGSRYVN